MKKSARNFLLVLLAISALALIYFSEKNRIANEDPKINGDGKTSVEAALPEVINGQEKESEAVIIKNLDTPWEIVFLPDNSFLVTERPGRLLHFSDDKKVFEVEGVVEEGEGGLMGLALDPEFSSNQRIYLYYTTRKNSELLNQVASYQLINGQLSDKKIIVDNIKAANNHNGGRIAFGPDGYLYIATGDAMEAELAQDTQSLNGKILRINKDGGFPSDNPFNNAVYSYGHRNVQGLAWDEQNRLWATEHGRSGINSGYDELNQIVKGVNYGWPKIQGDEEATEMSKAAIHSGPNQTWAPGGVTFYQNNLYFTGLRGESLYEARLDAIVVSDLIPHLEKKYGRLRTVKFGPDSHFYLLTSNRDGRGIPNKDDDQIIRLDPNSLN